MALSLESSRRAPTRDGRAHQVMSRLGLRLLAAWLFTACSVGHGEGELSGSLDVPGCHSGPYELGPTAFFGQAIQQLLRIRVQRGSDLEVRSDGVAILVNDATTLKKDFLGKDIDVSASDPRVDISLFLNDSCPPGRDKTPVVLPAVSGTIRFDAIYAPQVDKHEVQINATLVDIHFEDPRHPERKSDLSGAFEFLYQRGSPSQQFP
ncbi:MAG: hypothetical protein QM778_08155 [Myxococcales bacterium]